MAAPLTWIAPDDRRYTAAVGAVPATAHVPPRRPAAVAIPGDADGVVTAVRRATDLGLRVTVRSGGHGLGGRHLHDGDVVLDLRRLGDVVVRDGTARVGPGAVSRGLATALDVSGTRFPLGHSPAVGAGGFLLAGGNGWDGVRLGPACRRVLAATVVGGDGVLREVDAASDAELLAVLRGAGCAFPGVVTEFVARVEPGRPRISRSVAVLPPDRLGALGRTLDGARLDEGVEHTVILRPDVVTLVETGFRLDRSPVVPGRSVVDALGLTPVLHREELDWSGLLATIPDLGADGQLSDHRWSGAGWTDTLAVAAQALTCPETRYPGHPRSSVLVGAAPSEPPDPTGALYRAPGPLGVSVYGHHDRTGRVAARRWVADVVVQLDPLAVGRYVGEADLSAGAAALAACLPADGPDRIAAVRRRLDPDQVVRTVVDR